MLAKPLSLHDQIHEHALAASSRYKRAEAELIDILQKVESHRVFIKRGHASLFLYVTRELGLSESAAYALITVARKSREVPALKEQVQAGAMTLSNARRVASVLTVQNQGEWIQKASTLSNRQLEKEIVKVRPMEATPERATYVTSDRIKLEIGLSERQMLALRRVQDLLSQSKRRPVTLEETLSTMTDEFLRRHDPVKRAERHQVRKGGTSTVPQTDGQLVTLRVQQGTRIPLDAKTRHLVNLRDQRRCTHLLPNGSRCNQSRWVEIHHRVPVSQGGTNGLSNLITLCSAHHRFEHLDSN